MAMRCVRQTHDPRSVKVFECLLAGEIPVEIAASFGMSVQAVYKVKQRIRDRLRKFVAAQIRDEDEPNGRSEQSPPTSSRV